MTIRVFLLCRKWSFELLYCVACSSFDAPAAFAYTLTSAKGKSGVDWSEIYTLPSFILAKESRFRQDAIVTLQHKAK